MGQSLPFNTDTPSTHVPGDHAHSARRPDPVRHLRQRRRVRGFLTGAVLVPLVAVTACSAPPTAADRPASSAAGTDGPAAAGAPVTPADPTTGQDDAHQDFQRLEGEFDARLGLHAVDTGTGAEVEWRADERFAYTSTIKAQASAAVLAEKGVAGMEQRVAIEQSDIVPHSPVTEEHVGGTMTWAQIAEAAMTQSDNTAGNYLFEALDGPAGLDADLAEIGDRTTTVSRIEPELNEALPGDERDTTTPAAAASTLQDYALGGALDQREQAVFTEWLTSTQTGDTLVRANLPEHWRVGDKSGGGGYGTRNDIAVVWPDTGAPIVISVFSSCDHADADYDDRLIAEAAEAAVDDLR